MATCADRPITDVKVKVVYTKGVCVYGHKIGDEWVVGYTTPPGICNAAYTALYPHIRVLQRGGIYEYPKGSGVTRIGCPDPWNLVVFELSSVPGTTRECLSAPPGCGDLNML
jgi:uncharacterized repeat protein (TIGR04076 family)